MPSNVIERSPTIIRKRGDGGPQYSILFRLTDNDGAPVNLTGCTVWFTVKAKDQLDIGNDTTAIIAKYNTSHDDPLNGETIFDITSTDTNHEPGEYEYDIQIKYPDNSIMSIPTGSFFINQDVTKNTTTP